MYAKLADSLNVNAPASGTVRLVWPITARARSSRSMAKRDPFWLEKRQARAVEVINT